MLTYEEQCKLNTDIYEYTINEDTLNVYLTRGNQEEVKFNRAYIIGAFERRLALFDNSEGYTNLAKLFVKTFIVNNSVHCKDCAGNRINKWPRDYYQRNVVCLYDDITGKFLTYTKRPEFSHSHIEVGPSMDIYNGNCLTIEFNGNSPKKISQI